MLAPISATRYAKALFELARDTGKLEVVRDDLVALEALRADNPELAAALASPVLPSAARLGLLDALLEGRADGLTRRFLRFLESKRRLPRLGAIVAVYQELWREHSGILEVTLISAVPLPADQRAALEERLAKRFQRRIVAEVAVDPTLIGGFIVKVGDNILDFSIRAQLRRVEQHILSA